MIARRSPGLTCGHRPVEREVIAGLADAADHVGDDRGTVRLGLLDRPDVVVGVIERRADQVVHRRIDDDEGLGRPRFT